ncbi:BspA family leucine-rich repeat surface protein [Dyadobacter arcticus]|uniref:Surface protein n=1 Tax=Dyadobacter arcticus TaxID=1078754 RepID=A0ABX0USS0_9BACT|nr:BspA family leucine-rich repeat surface protein [Dyadobacter arcticus]NIJ54685.1 surface protein [Dyadobacter arcticus]
MTTVYSTLKFLFCNWQMLLASLFGIAFTGTHSYAQITAADYVTTWQTDVLGVSGPDQIIIPAVGEYTLYYESIPAGISGTLPETGTFTGVQTITFPAAGNYRVAIKPAGSDPFHRIWFDGNIDYLKLQTIEQWGTTAWSSMSFAYSSCFFLTTLPETDMPVMTNVTSTEYAFQGCGSLTGSSNMNNWDVSNVTNMQHMFNNSPNFNQPIGDWDVSKVTNMENMFSQADAFNQPIGGWDVSSVTNMKRMFRDASGFNQPLDSWNVGNVTDMSEMFFRATSFNQLVGSWNVSNLTNMQAMFRGALTFNQPVNNWNVANVTDMQGMFRDATAFNQPLNKWTFNPAVAANTMLNFSGIDCGNYNTTLIGWAANPATPVGRTIGVNARVYGLPAADAHNFLVNSKNWVLSGDAYDASCTSLPVILVSFVATKQEFSSLLTWSTTEETNSDHFEVQRSANAQNWKSIGTVASIGESKTLQTYNFSDLIPFGGINYYRLRMVDRDETFAFSRMQAVEFPGMPVLGIYPNPASDRLLIGNYPQIKQIELFNSKGVKLLENKKVTAQGIDISKLSPGLHTVKMVSTDGIIQTSKLVISR